MIKLRVDSRDKIHSKMFGQVITLPDECNFDSTLYDDVQPVGDVKCTCYTTCDIAEDQKKLTFDILDLWKRIPSNQQGADPRDVLGKVVSEKEDGGLLVVGESVRRRDWKSYWRADVGIRDPFDNLRSSMFVAQSPVGIATYWYDNWPSGETLPIGNKPMNGHMYVAEGWKKINGQPHLIIDAWIGRKLYMSREVFNTAMKPAGMQSWVLSTSEIDVKQTKNLMEIIMDLLINISLKLKEIFILKQTATVSTKPIIVQPEPVLEVKKEPEIVKPRFDWSTTTSTRHSCRVVMDEFNLTKSEKDLLCAVIMAESGMDTQAVNYNTDKYKSIDWGIAQINDHYWIGAGKPFASVKQILDYPELSVRFLVKQYKAGNLGWWYGYKHGNYKKYL